jgi:hypothetical protein
MYGHADCLTALRELAADGAQWAAMLAPDSDGRTPADYADWDCSSALALLHPGVNGPRGAWPVALVRAVVVGDRPAARIALLRDRPHAMLTALQQGAEALGMPLSPAAVGRVERLLDCAVVAAYQRLAFATCFSSHATRLRSRGFVAEGAHGELLMGLAARLEDTRLPYTPSGFVDVLHGA